MYHSQKIKINNTQHLATSILHSPNEFLVPSTKTIPLCVCMCVCMCVCVCVRARVSICECGMHMPPPPPLPEHARLRVCVECHTYSKALRVLQHKHNFPELVFPQYVAYKLVSHNYNFCHTCFAWITNALYTKSVHIC